MAAGPPATAMLEAQANVEGVLAERSVKLALRLVEPSIARTVKKYCIPGSRPVTRWLVAPAAVTAPGRFRSYPPVERAQNIWYEIPAWGVTSSDAGDQLSVTSVAQLARAASPPDVIVGATLSGELPVVK